MRPILVAGYQGKPYDRLARVLALTARRWCPDWEHRIERIDMSKPGAKYDHWRSAIDGAPDGTPIALLDCDTMILRGLDDVWLEPFDVAFTARDPKRTTHPNNAGVLFARAGVPSRAFFLEWHEAVLRGRLAGQNLRKAWSRDFGGYEQAALSGLLERTNAAIHALTCREWNCEQTEWGRFDGSTRIVHVKGSFRSALFDRATRLSPSRAREIKPLLELWRRLEKEAA